MRRIQSWVLMVLLAAGMGMTAGCDKSGNVATFKGTGFARTPAFTVTDQWQLEAAFRGNAIRVLLLNEYGEKVGHTFSQQGARYALWPYADGGTYKLEINCEDQIEWTLTVIDLE